MTPCESFLFIKNGSLILMQLVLITFHVKSLYTSIPNAEGIKTVKKSLNNHPKQTVAAKAITTFSAFTITLNNFIFNSRNYLQRKGYAMGTICAPSHANIFMDHFEGNPFIKGFALIYLRFIDDFCM